MLREVRLYGHLAKRFGRMHRFDVASPAEAVAALRANFRDFGRHVLRHNLPGYRVFVGKLGVAREDLGMTVGGAEPIRIVPVVAGAKNGGLLQIIIGAALIAASFVTGMPNWAMQGLQTIGMANVLGGVVNLLAPRPPGPKERPENTPSYLFDGAVNTTAQGQPVPVLLGRLVVGSAVISAGLAAEDLAGPAAPADPGQQTMPPEQPVIDWSGGAGG